MKLQKRKSKKALSEMVSYILLIVITITIAGMVATWLKFKATMPEDNGCPIDTSLIVKRYACDSAEKILNLTIENKGLFNVDGFFIRASKEAGKLPTIALTTTDVENPIEGRYLFISPLSPGDSKLAKFNYSSASPLERVQIQPFIYEGDNTNPVSCENIVTFNVELNDCKI